ncbi:MAG: VOC family protein [Planctomycetes bacterium]|nr:VOC family protein [Planctomycetota bacterium]HPF14171.1 VOC family protein [Planctomycetota bacterium]HRV81581.1 VOC family protein [Planctomycetota bacterium]
MGNVIGLGGIFFRSNDPAALRAWYAKHLGMPVKDFGAVFQSADVPKGGYHLWSPFEASSNYLGPNGQAVMINLMVDDLQGCLDQVRAAGAEGVRGPEDSDYGRFGWFLDPEGRQVELWEPSAEKPADAQ